MSPNLHAAHEGMASVTDWGVRRRTRH